MRTFELHTETDLPRPLEEVFAFFGDAGNLQKITPPWLHFRILTPLPLEMRPGALLDYRIGLHGLPLKWRSEITEWEPPHRFVDVQLRGPYRLWHHEHTFRPVQGGTRMVDHVRYAVWGGALVERLLVRRSVRAIFDYRGKVIARLLGGDETVLVSGLDRRVTGQEETPCIDSKRP